MVDIDILHGQEVWLDYIVLELAGGGELFDFIAESGRFNEPTARYYFIIKSLRLVAGNLQINVPAMPQ